MSVLNESQHEEIAELLPDYAVGALDDGELWRVEEHLDGCARCQAELEQLLELVGVLSPVTPPAPSVKQALFARAGLSPPLPAQHTDTPETAAPSPRRVSPWRAHPAWTALAVAAVVALLALGVLGSWTLLQQQELEDQREIVALLTDPEAAFPLTDAEVDTDASATFYADPDQDQALLVAQDLPSLDEGDRYQIWLFTESGERVDGGLFAPDQDGSTLTVVDPEAPIADYVAVGVSVEPDEGSDAPTSPLIIGGWIQ